MTDARFRSPDDPEIGEPGAADSSGGTAAELPGSIRTSGRLRWLLAIAVSTLVVAGSVAFAALLVGGAGPSGLLARAPADSLVYAELRLDLPGDQRSEAARFLAHFPGFDDQALLEAKLDDLLERAVGAASDGRVHWIDGIDRWFAGEAALVARSLPTEGVSAAEWVPLVLAAVADPAAAQAWLTATLDELGLPWTRDTAAETELVLVGGAVDRRAVAVADDVLIGGREADVRAALETTPATSLGAADRTKAAAAALPADHVAWLYVDGVASREWLAGVLGDLGTPLTAAGLPIPDWTSAELRFDGDALVVESVTPAVGSRAATHAPSRLAGHVPDDVVAFAALGGVGSLVLERVEKLRENPALRPSLDSVLAALERVGGLEAIVGWIDELGLVVGSEAGEPWVAALAVPTDRAPAEALAGSFLNLARLSLPGLRVEEASADGTTIVSAAIPAPGGGQGFSLSWAIGAEVVVVAPDAATVRGILAVDAETSLVAAPRYATLLARAGGPAGSSVIFVDLGRLRALGEAMLPPAEAARYERDVRPYLEPFEAAIAIVRSDGSLERHVLIVRVAQVE